MHLPPPAQSEPARGSAQSAEGEYDYEYEYEYADAGAPPAELGPEAQPTPTFSQPAPSMAANPPPSLSNLSG